ncbi:hypothetical protein D3C87_1897380 [compost metagenome]
MKVSMASVVGRPLNNTKRSTSSRAQFELHFSTRLRTKFRASSGDFSAKSKGPLGNAAANFWCPHKDQIAPNAIQSAILGRRVSLAM